MKLSCSLGTPTPEESVVFQRGKLRVADFLTKWAELQWAGPGEAPTAGSQMTMLSLLASCYLQGARDTAEAIVQAGWRPPDE